MLTAGFVVAMPAAAAVLMELACDNARARGRHPKPAAAVAIALLVVSSAL